jgi:hypothetical protein
MTERRQKDITENERTEESQKDLTESKKDVLRAALYIPINEEQLER